MKRFSTLLIALSMITLSMSSCQREPLEEAIPEKPITTKAASRIVEFYVNQHTDFPLWMALESFSPMYLDTAIYASSPQNYSGYIGSINLYQAVDFNVWNSTYDSYLKFKSWSCISNNATKVNTDGAGDHIARFIVNDPNDTSPIKLYYESKSAAEMAAQ